MFYEGTGVGVKSRQTVAGAFGGTLAKLEVKRTACAADSGKLKEMCTLPRGTPWGITYKTRETIKT